MHTFVPNPFPFLKNKQNTDTMRQTFNWAKGQEPIYEAPTLEELCVAVECGFLGSLTEDTDTPSDGYDDYENGEY